MRRARPAALVLTLALAPLAFAACKKRPPTTAADVRPPIEKVAGPPATTVAPPPAGPSSNDPSAEILSQDLDALNRKGYLVDAFFDYDQAELREDARGTLSRDAEWLKRFPSVQVLLEGHCDERGTTAYNLALGQRRAAAAREYLVSLGIPESRIKAVSYGKEKPFCEADSEGCWQQNRRDHVLVTSK